MSVSINNQHIKVVVAMSGGVDSSVAATLLKEKGYDVTGIMLRLWSEPETEIVNRCCSPDAMTLARRVASRLNIPFYTVDAQDIFYSRVVQYFINGYYRGITPNPCIACNRYIRWEFLYNYALTMGANYLATGHYARVDRNEAGNYQLLKGVDSSKDQSYVLFMLGQEQLSHALFPLGEFLKTQVRQIAHEFDLPVADRSESQDLCFLANSDVVGFLKRHAPQTVVPGPILDETGKHLGEHMGLSFYTIGQRKGLGISSPSPLYVLQKDFTQNALVVGKKEELDQKYLIAQHVTWVAGEPPSSDFDAQIKIRYKACGAIGKVTILEKDIVYVVFDQPIWGITPGQAVVFYESDVVLGGGIITDHVADGSPFVVESN